MKRMSRAAGAAVLGAALAAAAACGAEIDKASKIRILPGDRPDHVYGVRIAPPWEDGGFLYINLPEHLEISGGGPGILRWSDGKKGQTARWTPAEDGLSASLEAKGVEVPGSSVKGIVRVVGRDRVEITMLIVNGSQRTFPSVCPLYCFQYKDLKGFPRWVDNFKHCHFPIDGKATVVTEAKREKMDSLVVAAGVAGCADPGRSEFTASFGGIIERGVDAAVCAVTAMDGRRKIVFGWTPARSILSNAQIPCIHADPFYGEIKPGESRNVLGVLVFTEEPVEEAVAKLVKEGIGAPASKVAPARLKEIQENGTK